MEKSQLKDWKCEESEGPGPVLKHLWECQRMGCLGEGRDGKGEMGKLERKL